MYVDEEDNAYRGFAFVQKRNVINELNKIEIFNRIIPYHKQLVVDNLIKHRFFNSVRSTMFFAVSVITVANIFIVGFSIPEFSCFARE